MKLQKVPDLRHLDQSKFTNPGINALDLAPTRCLDAIFRALELKW